MKVILNTALPNRQQSAPPDCVAAQILWSKGWGALCTSVQWKLGSSLHTLQGTRDIRFPSKEGAVWGVQGLLGRPHPSGPLRRYGGQSCSRARASALAAPLPDLPGATSWLSPQGVIEFSLCLLFAKLVSYTFLFWLPLYITSVGEYVTSILCAPVPGDLTPHIHWFPECGDMGTRPTQEGSWTPPGDLQDLSMGTAVPASCMSVWVSAALGNTAVHPS